MLLRGMHDRGCDEIYVIVTDLKRHEMDQVSEYFQYVCQNTSSGYCKSSAEQKINHDCECHKHARPVSPVRPSWHASSIPHKAGRWTRL